MYYTYMLRCLDGSLYTGITTDVFRRFAQHRGEEKGGAKCTKGRRPIAIERVWACQSRSEASKLEYRIKKLSKVEKEKLIEQPDVLQELMGDKLDIQPYRLQEVRNMVKEKILELKDEKWEFLGVVKPDMTLGSYSLFWGRSSEGFENVINGYFEEFDEASICISPEILCNYGDETITYTGDSELMDFVYKQIHSSVEFKTFRHEYEKLQYEGVTSYLLELIKDREFLFIEKDDVETEDGIAMEFHAMLDSGLFVSGLIYEIEDEYRNSFIDFAYDELLYISLDDANYFVKDPYLKDYIVHTLENLDFTC